MLATQTGELELKMKSNESHLFNQDNMDICYGKPQTIIMQNGPWQYSEEYTKALGPSKIWEKNSKYSFCILHCFALIAHRT